MISPKIKGYKENKFMNDESGDWEWRNDQQWRAGNNSLILISFVIVVPVSSFGIINSLNQFSVQ